MYFIETLKTKYPTLLTEITTYDTFLKRYHSAEYVEKIFNDEKENFKYVNAAYNALYHGNVKEYQINMCYFERSLNDDPDFLDYIKGETNGSEGNQKTTERTYKQDE